MEANLEQNVITRIKKKLLKERKESNSIAYRMK